MAMQILSLSETSVRTGCFKLGGNNFGDEGEGQVRQAGNINGEEVGCPSPKAHPDTDEHVGLLREHW